MGSQTVKLLPRGLEDEKENAGTAGTLGAPDS